MSLHLLNGVLKMLNQITANDLIAAFAPNGSTDDIRIFNEKGRAVGYITDLRIKFDQKHRASKKQKEYNNKITEERREKMPEAVNEMVEFLSNNLQGEAFINISQPNVKINGCTCYITVDPMYDNQHRLAIMHRELTTVEMIDMVKDFRVSSGNTSDRQVLFNGLTRDDIVETIKKVCK